MDGHLLSDLPAEERPRERLERLGAWSLSVPELLAILLRTGVRGCGATTVGTKLLEHFGGSLGRLSQAPLGELTGLLGVGPAKAVTLAAAFELGRRQREEETSPLTQLSSSAEVADYLRTRFRRTEQEEFHVVFLSTKNQVLEEDCITVGLLDRTLVHAREVFRRAVRIGCQKVILAHNHPSGDPRPSKGDIKMTRELEEAGELLDIKVLDHVILGSLQGDPTGRGFFSFGQAKLLTSQQGEGEEKGGRRKEEGGS